MKMKQFNLSILLAFVAMLATHTVSLAQSQFGIRGGLNVSNVSFENLPDKSERFGYHIGVFADVPVAADFISVQPELSYSVKGTAYKFLNERQTLNMNYLDFLLPVAFKLGSIDIQVGPFASYLTSTPNYTVYNDHTIVVDAFNKYDLGLTAGLSFNFNKMFLGIRYNQGMVNVVKDNAQLFLGNGKNAVGQVSIGVKL